MKNNILLMITLAILSMAGNVRGQSSGRYPSPVIGYETRLACQIDEPKMQTHVEDEGICHKACRGSVAEVDIVVVRNILGQVMAERAIVAEGGPVYLSLTRFVAGIYTVEYRQEGRLIAIEKLVKQ